MKFQKQGVKRLTDQVKQLMETLDLTEEQALELIESDKEIDKGAKLFELTPEQEKASKKARATGTRTQTAPTKRERKEDPDKRFLIDLINKALAASDDPKFTETPNIEITNPERQIDFVYNDRKFRVVLSAPRT